MSNDALSDDDYQSLLALRTDLRRFLKWSGDRARSVGLTPAQHQLLLAIRGHAGDAEPMVSDLAEYLQLRHHSAVELIDRVERDGFVARRVDPDDARIIRLSLTPKGEATLSALTAQHVEELHRLAPRMTELLNELD